jgi:DNA-binding NarL/FixJ family response regulator
LKTELVLGRCAGSPEFSEQDKALVVSLVPTLSLAVLAHHHKKAEASFIAPSRRLTAREREVMSYLRLGYTNLQIGLALGTRERTVRNQLSSIYEKLGVATRAEAVGTLAPGS